MNCIICGNSAESAICQNCAGLEPQEAIRTYCLNSASKNPLQMSQAIMNHPGFPVAGHLHHALVAAVLVAAYRNAGGEVSPEKLDEAIKRGNSIPGGFCAGFGADAAAIACGIAVSLINGNTINAEHATGRAQAHALTGEAMLNIANNSGNRCCKRSVYGVLELATNYFNRVLGSSLEAPQESIRCPFTRKNKLCNGKACKYHPA
ncbi:DUF5714 domain-containing protein [Geobacter sp.]|uniref:DUF5714 domain-containing protein n=1 Tax=Geobacter sp. TaxID=46610 RepID=UPI00260888F6|nr:DUF5714 domain-containing protein [Geobacter sp.]